MFNYFSHFIVSNEFRNALMTFSLSVLIKLMINLILFLKKMLHQVTMRYKNDYNRMIIAFLIDKNVN